MKYLVFLSFLLITQSTFGQCAMCKATVEKNIAEGAETIGAGLNTGILYLMAIPYIVFAIIGFFWYKQSKVRKKIKIGNIS